MVSAITRSDYDKIRACLIAIAVRASAKFPLIVAANRDEDYERPTLPAGFWPESPHILGGRDALHRGSWLAITTSGRFAAVTNLRGARPDPWLRSRGELVSGFVRGAATSREYIDEIASREHEYAGFHLLVGDGEVFEGGGEPPRAIDGIHALSNAPAGERWPKVDLAEEEMRRLAAIDDAAALVDASLQFLASRRGEVFIAGDRYGTRSSTVIVASEDRITFVEQAYARGGVRDGSPQRFEFSRSESRSGSRPRLLL